MVFEAKSIILKTKVCTKEDWGNKSEFTNDEEMQLAIPEAKKGSKVHISKGSGPENRDQESGTKTYDDWLETLEVSRETESPTEDSKGENVRRRKEIRNTLAFLRKTAEVLHSEVRLTEGGFKQNSWYLGRIEAASLDHLGLTGGVTKAEEKWEGISGFPRISKLLLLKNKETFQDFIVNWSWNENKYGKLFNQFLTANETMDDDDVDQLALIMRNKQAVLRIAHCIIFLPLLSSHF